MRNIKKHRGVSCVYSIVNKKSGREYVGETKNLHSRIINHIYNLKKNSHDNPRLQKDFNSIGVDGFYVKIIHRSKKWHERCAIESATILFSNGLYNRKSNTRKYILHP